MLKMRIIFANVREKQINNFINNIKKRKEKNYENSNKYNG